jgi:hypothetical protein
MTMHLLPAFYTTNVNTKKKNNKKKTQSRIEHENWLRRQGLGKVVPRNKKGIADSEWRKSYAETLKVEKDNYESSGLSGSKEACAKKGIMENLHKEPEHVRKEILIKASRCMPLFNKGGLQYASPGEDLTKVGTKSRRG